jgi:predicted nucleic acid-binding protein
MKWYLPDEEYAVESDTLLTAFSLGQIVLIAPQHIYYEVSNALRTAVHRGRLAAPRAHQAMLEFLELNIPSVIGTQLIVRGWDAAMRYGCALYDGLYVALSELLDAPLVHADERLRNTLAKRFPHEQWIEDLDFTS